ncbi:MAG: phosphoenolpyruvate carboxylase, partial [Myxococcales bacterium]|nr:phosphoenolpyruvate carboxylase [Myxococcales bacterium]
MELGERRLRDDVRLLGDRLGWTLKESGGAWLFELVEEVRRLAKGARAGRSDDAVALRKLLSELEVERAAPLARAFSHFLALANIAEHRHRARTWESAREHGGNVRATLAKLKADAASPNALFDAVTALRIELV